jgi:hypothetical protein
VEISAEKTKYKYMLLSRHQNAGHNHAIKNTAEFEYLETTVSNFDSRGNEERDELEYCLLPFIPELLSPRLLPKNVKIKIYKTTILPMNLGLRRQWKIIRVHRRYLKKRY